MKKFNVTVNGKQYEVEVEEIGGSAAPVRAAAAAPAPPKPAAAPAPAPVPAGAGTISAPMSGTLTKYNVKVGDTVKRGDVVALLEAMKMENDIPSPVDGVVKQLGASEGSAVQPGDVIVVIG